MFSELSSEIRYRLRALFRRRAVEQELDDELRFHLEHEAAKYERMGATRGHAMRQARLAFGGVDRIKDDTRDARGVAMIETLARDVRFALRGIRGHPGFSAAVIATLGLGIGVNAAMFGVLDRLLLRPPAYLASPERVHRVFLGWTQNGRRGGDRAIEYLRYEDIAKGTTSFDAAAAFNYRRIAVGSGEDVKEQTVGVVSASYFDFFNARPVIGRFYLPSEDLPPSGFPVAVLGYDFWQTRYGGRQDALGARLKIGRVTYTIVGVAPKGFTGVSDQRRPAAFIPLTSYAVTLNPTFTQNYDWNWLEVLVRRKPGVGVETANADLTTAYLQSWNKQRTLTPELDPVSVAKPSATVEPLQLGRGPAASEQSRVVVWVSGVAFIVLLIACANVANLLLVRSLRRRREMALRVALGGTRGRLFQQMLTETLVLAACGGVAGIIAAQWGGGALRRLFLVDRGSAEVVGDTRTLIFSLVVTFAAALMAGLAPSLQQKYRDLADSLKAGSRESSYAHSRLRSVLLVFQAALSVVLLIGAGLFVRSLGRVNEIRLGYDIEPVLSVVMTARGVELTNPEMVALRSRMVEEARAVPGVALATPNASVPFYVSETRRLVVPGIDSVARLGQFRLQAGSADYFATVGTRILRGRGITTDDRETAPRIAIVGESMARVLWPGREAIGQRFRFAGDSTRDITVVGIAEDIKTRNRIGDPEFHFYLPIEQYGPSDPQILVRVKTRGSEMAEAIRQRLQRVMPGAAYVTVLPMSEIVGPTTRSWRSMATMFTAFGGLSLVVAAIGLYSLIAFAVTQRAHEIGVRIALGAQVDDVLRLVIGEGLGLALTGIAIGTGVALLASGRISQMLYRVSPRDPVVYLMVVLILVVVAALASAIPAMRAARVDPNVALRTE